MFFTTFLASATKQQRDFFGSTVSGSAADDVERMRATVVKGGLSGDMPGLEGRAWFNATPVRIDPIKTV